MLYLSAMFQVQTRKIDIMLFLIVNAYLNIIVYVLHVLNQLIEYHDVGIYMPTP